MLRAQWDALRDLLHKSRRGPQDPAWLAGWAGMIAAGALVIGTAAAVRGTNQGTNQAALIAGMAVAGVGVIGVLVCLGLAAARYFEDAAPPLTITHDPANCPDCSEVVSVRVGGEFRQACQVRLHVTNTGRVGVQRVRAYMRVLQAGALHARDHFLHVQHDNDPIGLRVLSRSGENLTVGQPVHFDVALVSLPDWSKPIPAVIRFEYTDPAISDRSEIPLGPGQYPPAGRPGWRSVVGRTFGMWSPPPLNAT